MEAATAMSITLISPSPRHSRHPPNLAPSLSHQILRFPHPPQTPTLKNRVSTARCSADGSVQGEEKIPIEKQFLPFPLVMDINQIREILPHRFPMLLVDQVIEYKPGETAVGIKNVTINDYFFQGHFPDRPIMPGVLMVEAMAQVGGIVLLQLDVGGSWDNFYLAGIDKVRFRKPVSPGDTLVMRVTLVKLQKILGMAKMEGKAYVGGEVVCEGEFLLAMGSTS